MVENHLYFAIVHYRWFEHPERAREGLFKDIPALIRKPIFSLIMKKVRRDSKGHGMGGHGRADILAFAMEDLSALSVLLADKPFLFGDDPTSVDATIYGALENIINSAEASQLQDAARSLENLPRFCNRFRDRVFDPPSPQNAEK